MRPFLVWFFIAIAVWKLVWFLIYSLIGFHIGYLSINNGFAINNVHFTSSKVSVSASSIRLRLWGNSKRFIISDLQVTLNDELASKPKKHSSHKLPVSNGPVSIYPKHAQIVFKYLLKLLPQLDFEFKNSSVNIHSEVLDIETLRFIITSHRKEHSKDTKKFGCQLIGYNISSSSSSASTIPPLSIGEFTAQLKPSVHLKTGIVNEVALRLYLDDLKINVFQAIKKFIFQDPNSLSKPPKKHHSHDEKALMDHLIALHNKFILSVKNISVDICNSRIEGIPCIPADKNSDIEAYFSQIQPDLSTSISVRSMSLQFEHLIDMAAGFTLFFNNNWDRPFQMTSSISLLQWNFVKKKYDESCQRHHFVIDEFLNVPNMTLTLRTNILDHLAKGLGFRDCTAELYSSISNPVLDLDYKEFALLAYNYLTAKKALALKKLRKSKLDKNDDGSRSQTDSDIDDDYTRVGTDSPTTETFKKDTMFERLVHLLNEFYPRIGVKCAIEQPRLIIRVEENNQKTIRLIDLSFSMMYIHVMTTRENDYDAVCQVLHPCLAFTERISEPERENCFRMTEEVIGATSAKLQVTVLKNLKFKSSVLIEAAYANLAKPDVLNGINKILTETARKTISYFQTGFINNMLNDSLVKEFGVKPKSSTHEQPPVDGADSFEGLFRKLPPWFVSFEFELTDLEIILGCTSPLLPPQLIGTLSPEAMMNTSHVVQLTFTQYRMSIYNDEHDSNKLELESTSLNSEETLARDEKSMFWKIDSSLEKVQLLAEEEGLTSTPVLEVQDLFLNFSSIRDSQGNGFLLDGGAPIFSGCIDRHKIFNILGLIHLIIQTIVLPLKSVQTKLKHEMEAFERFASSQNRASLDKVLTVNVNIDKIDYVAELSDEFRTRLQIFKTRFFSKDNKICLDAELIRFLADSPTVKGFWSRLCCVDTLRIATNDESGDEKVAVRTEAIRLIHPHKFVTYKLFDNLSIFMKIIKHLVKCMKTEDKTTVIWPNESKALQLPHVKVLSGKVNFLMEDDSFEAELGMIFQLGLVEQRKRLEMEIAFDERVKREKASAENVDAFYEAMSMLWIRKVNSFKERLANEMNECKRFLVGNEVDLPASENHRICPYLEQPPLLSILMTGFDTRMSTTQFPLGDLPKFIYQLGQQVPMDTRYNLMVPSYIDLCVQELRINLRDYPLPLLHLPRATNSDGRGKALFMRGHLIICEALVLAKENMRQLEVNLSRLQRSTPSKTSKYERLLINKSLSTVKLYSDLDIRFGSSAPCRFVWGQSYQFGIQQCMLNFDSFSKPPIDPSPKLGFWDKMRYIIHGKFLIKAEGSTAIEVAFKGGRDPYNLFSDSSGFILSFQDGITWMINENDDSLQFFDIHAQKVSWYIPNYLAAPLLSWTRDSTESTYVSDIPDLVTSIYGYYLNEIPPHAASEDAENPDLGINEKSVIELSGGVRFKWGFLLQRPENGKMTSWCRPHYDVNLYDPKFCGENHDSFAGFRSTRIHMAITLIAFTDKSSNTIHLTPGTFRQFFKWWKMFQGNMMLPVRRGKVFGELKKSAKFSQHLYTIKFLFHVKELFMSHVYREEKEEDNESDIVRCYGLRAKVEEFLVDLHQRKEERVTVDRASDQRRKILKMAMNLGEVVLSKIDLRVLYAEILRNLYSQQQIKHEDFRFKTFDNDKQWCDARDLHEAFVSSSRSSMKRVDVYPMMFSERFSYIRDTSHLGGKSDWGSEETHDCKLHTTDVHETQIRVYEERIDDLRRLQKLSPQISGIGERINVLQSHINQADRARRTSIRRDSVQHAQSHLKESFHNRFVLSSMFLKWNADVRNNFMKYLFFAQLNSDFRKYLSYEYISMLESKIHKQDAVSECQSSVTSVTHAKPKRPELGSALNKFDSAQLRLDNFDTILRSKTGSKLVREDFKVEIVSPQIQLHAEEVTESVVIVSAPVLELKILTLLALEDSTLVLNAKELETRYGALLHNASVTVVDKSDVLKMGHLLERRPYGTRTKWPPWLGTEICKDIALSDPRLAVVKHMSMMLTYDKVQALAAGFDLADAVGQEASVADGIDEMANRLRIDVPKLEISSTSKQYFSLYATVIGLLMYVEQSNVVLREKLLKLKFSMDFEDYLVMHRRLVSLNQYLSAINLVLRGYSFRHNHLNNEDLNLYWLLNTERDSISTEIVFLLTSLFSGDTFSSGSAKPLANWRIGADEIVLHMLQDTQEPILDLKVLKGRYKRRIREDGSNDNRIELNYIEGVNLLQKAFYLKFVESITNPGADNLITLDWSMNREVGGIRIMEYFDIKSQPLTINLDEVVGRQLMKFLFQIDSENDISKSPLTALNDREHQGEESKEDENEQGPGSRELSPTEGGQDSQSAKKRLPKRFTSLKGSSTSSGGEEFNENVLQMMERSKKFLSVGTMTFSPFNVMISLRFTTGLIRWLNVTNILLELPGFHVEKRVISMLEIAELMKKMVIKTLLSHSGRILENKITLRRHNRKRLKAKLH